MPFVKLENDTVIAYATSPPSAEAKEWIEVSEDDPAVVEFLSRAAPVPNWGAFRIAVLNDPGFRLLLGQLMQIDPQTAIALQIEAGKDEPFVGFVVGSWNALVERFEGEIDPEAIAEWNAIAAENNIPLRWVETGDDVGKLEA